MLVEVREGRNQPQGLMERQPVSCSTEAQLGDFVLRDGVPSFRVGPSIDQLVTVELRSSWSYGSSQGHRWRARPSLGEMHDSFASILTDFMEEQIVGGSYSPILEVNISIFA